MSSEDAFPTGGQYGSVMAGTFSLSSPSPTSKILTDFLLRQIYSLTRVATLFAIILNFVALDATTPINCQVGSASQLYVIIAAL